MSWNSGPSDGGDVCGDIGASPGLVLRYLTGRRI
jgi:hypothetical protein